MSEIKHELALTQNDVMIMMKKYLKASASSDRSKMPEEERILLENLERARDCGCFEAPFFGGHFMRHWKVDTAPVQEKVDAAPVQEKE